MKARLMFIVTCFLLLFACNNEDSVESFDSEGSAFSVVGRWYTEIDDKNNSERNMYGEYTFTIGGAVYVDEYWRINGYRRHKIDGTYSVNGNTISANLNYKRTSTLECSDRLSFRAAILGEEKKTFLRIVGDLALSVGDTTHIDVNNYFETYSSISAEKPSYSVTDKAIVSVDETGLLTAKLIGTTFVQVGTSAGIAVLKIYVDDKKSRWNDFSSALGKNLDEVKQLLGERYAFKNDSTIRYYYDNAYVDSVDIYEHNNIADSLVVIFRPEVSDSIIMNYFVARGDTTVKDSISNNMLICRWYTDNKNFLLSTYSARYYPQEKKVIYTYIEPDWDDRRSDYGLSYEDLKKKYGYPSTPAKFSTVGYSLKKDFIRQVFYSLSPNIVSGSVTSYSMYLNSDVTKEMVENYLYRKYNYCENINYEAYIQSYEHGLNIQIDGDEFVLFVKYERKEHKLLYYIKSYK